MTLEERYARYRSSLAGCGQGHLLAFWAQIDTQQRGALLDDLDQIDFDRCATLIDTLVCTKAPVSKPDRLEPAPAYPAEPASQQAQLYQSARAAGVEAIRRGQVAAITVAGGQGTRLGYDGPKGGLRISPVRDACLFQLFAEYLRGVRRRYGALPRWYIMTSPTNHAATIRIFEEHEFFGLRREHLVFFRQGQMPAFLPDGRIALADKHRVALGPDGHGGSLSALAASGALEDMRSRGIEIISYFQVDNPLVKPIDPLFVGLHLTSDSEMSSKAVTKAHDLERVGNFCLADGALCVIEYSDLSEDLARAKNPDGSRRFDAGSIAIHLISRSFVERLTRAGSGAELPWHRAEKKLAVIDDDGHPVEPAAPNVVKLELFVFDAIRSARNPLLLYTPRAEEFSPVKNAEGDDSPATARRDLVERAAGWLEACGVRVPRDEAGESAAPLEVSPAFALDANDLRDRLDGRVRVEAGKPFVLD